MKWESWFSSLLNNLSVSISSCNKFRKPIGDDHILAITKDNDYLQNPGKQAKVKEYERQIDQMVYKLYGLTSDEIKVPIKSELPVDRESPVLFNDIKSE